MDSTRPVRRPSHRVLLKLVLALFGLVVASSIGAPWWKITKTAPPQNFAGHVSDPGKALPKAEQDRIVKEQAEWALSYADYVEFYRDYDVFRPLEKDWETQIGKGRMVGDLSDDSLDKSVSYTIWGFAALPGILSCVFGGLIFIWALIALFVRVMWRWTWIGGFVCMGLAVPVVILSIAWLVNTPGDDVFLYSQHVVCGPFVAGGAAILAFVFGLLELILGLVACFRRPQAAAAPASPSPSA
ncbi:MAG: hypothetical protein BIFFINMI_03086 [Phycisphaerae bacterium]|nr:hypothetical protein [Phycisphaerae bacterium]